MAWKLVHMFQYVLCGLEYLQDDQFKSTWDNFSSYFNPTI